MRNKREYTITPEEQADYDAMYYYEGFKEYIFEQNNRFFFGQDNSSAAPFFEKLDKLLPNLEKIYPPGEILYRARIVEGLTNSYSLQEGHFEAFSKDELAAPPKNRTKEGRINPNGVPYLYLAKTRPCALAEVRPPIGSTVAIGVGILSRKITVASFIDNPAGNQSLFEKSMVSLIGDIFSMPVNGQNDIEYIPSQVISEYIKNIGFDGIEYYSSQYKSGVNLALFNINDWYAESSITFDVTDIKYSTNRNQCLVECFGYPDEKL